LHTEFIIDVCWIGNKCWSVPPAWQCVIYWTCFLVSVICNWLNFL